jgi:uncharacterized protein YggE
VRKASKLRHGCRKQKAKRPLESPGIFYFEEAVVPTMRISEQRPSKAARRVLAATAVLAAITVAAPAHAQQPPASPPPEARVVVVGEASVQVAPDYAQIRGGVTTRAKTVQEATDANSKLMAAVMAALHDAGIAPADIRTAQFSIQPLYAVPQSATENKLTGYNVSNQVTVKVRPIDKVAGIIDRMVVAGATDVSNVSMLHADTVQALDQARTAALADARRKAELYAHAGGFTLGRVAGITEDAGPMPFGPMFRMTAAAPGAMQQVPISAGEDTLRVRLTVGYDIASW